MELENPKGPILFLMMIATLQTKSSIWPKGSTLSVNMSFKFILHHSHVKILHDEGQRKGKSSFTNPEVEFEIRDENKVNYGHHT